MTDSTETAPTTVRQQETADAESGRLAVLKTYKLYIGGKFPRTESGRYDRVLGAGEEPIANLCRASRKDLREAVVAARQAQSGWAQRSAYNRAQILYRIAEMLEGRAPQFVQELIRQGLAEPEARLQVEASIDRLVYFTGWADKYQQVFSSVNPVASSHFNFSLLEPVGVVAILAPEDSFLGLVSVIAPVIVGGNTSVVLAGAQTSLAAVSFAEVLHSSDVPGGVVNILTGRRAELLEPFASHMDINALLYCGKDGELIAKIRTLAAANLKRVQIERTQDWGTEAENPYSILDFQEVKTTWHPIGS